MCLLHSLLPPLVAGHVSELRYDTLASASNEGADHVSQLCRPRSKRSGYSTHANMRRPDLSVSTSRGGGLQIPTAFLGNFATSARRWCRQGLTFSGRRINQSKEVDARRVYRITHDSVTDSFLFHGQHFWRSSRCVASSHVSSTDNNVCHFIETILTLISSSSLLTKTDTWRFLDCGRILWIIMSRSES